MITKKCTVLTIAGIFAATMTLNTFAGSQTSDDSAPTINGSGFTLGLNYATWGVNNFALTGGYVNHWISVMIGSGYRYDNATATNASSHMFELRSELGLRQSLEHSLFFTYGLLGSRGFRDQAFTTDPYSVGGYIGLDYQPLQHVLLSAQITPYDYFRDENKVGHSNVFNEGSFGASYIFN